MATARDEVAVTPAVRDPAARDAAAYVAALTGALGLLLVAVVGLNLLLGDRALGSPRVTRAASEWQARTHGVTYPPPITRTRPFKSLRLQDRLPGIDGVVLGSSTGMGITASMFPPAVRVYNLTVAGNSASGVVGEAMYIERHLGASVKWLFLVLDWSVGGIYLAGPAEELDLSPKAQLADAARPGVPLHQRLVDTLALPKVKNLGGILLRAVRSPDPFTALREAFLQDASGEYTCRDGTPAKDFDVVNRGECSGYRYDGSWTYFAQDRLRESEVRALAQAATSSSSKYTQYLVAARGEPFRPYLAAIAEVARVLRGRGGRLIVILPPLVPGMEQALLASPESGPYLVRTKSAIQNWAGENGIVVLDAGQAERYGCTGTEFTDEHHAAPECFARVMGRFWRDYGRDGLAPGLYGPVPEGR